MNVYSVVDYGGDVVDVCGTKKEAHKSATLRGAGSLVGLHDLGTMKKEDLVAILYFAAVDNRYEPYELPIPVKVWELTSRGGLREVEVQEWVNAV